jgi:hypothetical protein
MQYPCRRADDPCICSKGEKAIVYVTPEFLKQASKNGPETSEKCPTTGFGERASSLVRVV